MLDIESVCVCTENMLKKTGHIHTFAYFTHSQKLT